MQWMTYTMVFVFGIVVGSIATAVAIAFYEYRNRDEDEILRDEILKENHLL